MENEIYTQRRVDQLKREQRSEWKEMKKKMSSEIGEKECARNDAFYILSCVLTTAFMCLNLIFGAKKLQLLAQIPLQMIKVFCWKSEQPRSND